MSGDRAEKTSLIVGSGGQDGYYLTELLRARGHHVIGVGRGDTVSTRLGALERLDILDRDQVARALIELEPDEVYYLAAYHHSSEAGKLDHYDTFRRSNDIHVFGLLNFLDGMEKHALRTRLFYAASSHVFGDPATTPQTDATPLAPVCIYGITKSAGVGLCRLYRRERGVYCSAGMLYNHESPRRPAQFVSRKIVRAAVDIKLGKQDQLTLGNLAAQIDWGAAQDYVRAMSDILKLEQPSDFVIASGTLHTVRQFVEIAFSTLELPWQSHVTVDTSLLSTVKPRKALVGDSAKLRAQTGWQPAITFEQMVRDMVTAELNQRQLETT